ncbi:hypothetical protein Tel_02300 [Candidatus Tenderia electrophaga]|uniref:SH3b domain-containing protein n=1 Tax=Candidatus Tenderia electrophaga TaxID=1748243 RepID=A0A0S2TAA4_9GAMM|nr:hypothetical protein Tel_02300 [Candidatus Tenderia electrophaga]
MKAAFADSAYVTDQVSIAVFPKADLSGEPVERLLSGTPVEVLQTTDGVAEVKTGAGNSGWMRSDFLTSALPAVVKLEQAETELREANMILDAADEKIARLEKEQAALKKQAEAAKELGWMRAELSKARDKAAALEKQLASQQAETSEVDQQAETLEQRIATLETENQDLQKRLGAVLMISDDTQPATREQPPAAPASFPWSAVALVLGLAAGFAAGYYWLERRLRQRFGGIKVY